MSCVPVALVLAAGACGGQSQNTQPQLPADQPTTTGATTSESFRALTPTGATTVGGADGSSSTGDQSNQNGSVLYTHSTLLGGTTAGTTSTGGVASSGSNATGTGTSTPEVVALSDAQTVAVVQTANHGEIEQAHEALHKAKSARVRQFAQHLITDDSAADERLSKFDAEVGITPRTSAVAERVRLSGEQVLSNLKTLASTTDFDRLYVGAQVTEHTKVLEILDDTLIPHVQDPDLVKILHATRAKVANGLRMALDIAAALSNASQ
jgi:predicted outer membrane protein